LAEILLVAHHSISTSGELYAYLHAISKMVSRRCGRGPCGNFSNRGARRRVTSDRGGQIADAAADASGVRVFKGIPYAAPPVGELRWKAPQPVQPWNGIRSIAEWGPRCVQSSRLGDLDPLNKRMDEDCLYLNVWTPATSSSQSLPVMVWVHGGSNL